MRGEGLGRGDADFRAGVQVNAAVRLAGDRRADDVANRQRRMPFALALSHRGQRVGRFPALRDGEDHRHIGHRRIAIPELAGVFHLGRNPRELFQQVFTDQSRVPARAAGCQHDAVHAAQVLRVEVQAAELGGRFFLVQPSAEGVFDGLGLLEDFLEHVMLKSAAVGVADDRFEDMDRRGQRARIAVREFQPRRLEDDDFMVRQIGDLVGVAHERTGIAGQEELFPSHADHERAPQAGPHNRVRKVAEKDRQAISPLEHGQRLFKGRQANALVDVSPFEPRLLVEVVGDQVGDRLGVGPRPEDVTQLLQLVPQDGVVFDDAVVHQHHFAVAADVRVRIEIGRGPVRGPSSVPDADRSGEWGRFQRGRHRLHASRFFPDTDPSPLRNGDPGTVVAAIFQPVQTLQKELLRRPIADIAHDPAHGFRAPSLHL